MTSHALTLTSLIVTACGAAFFLGVLSHHEASAETQRKARVFEIRTYTTEEGRLEALNARFRDHTTKLFEKHKMTSIGYWTPADAPLSANTLIYILAHPSREEARKNWAEFQNDPDWKRAREESEASGKIVKKVESVFVDATDYSPIK
jgi:hypothetical protein